MTFLNIISIAKRLLFWAIILFFGSSLFAVIVFRWLPVPFTPLMFIRCIEQAEKGETIRLRHDWTPLTDISPALPRAVIASEDQRFLEHNGFDFVEIGNAIEERLEGGRQRGGSTISQQTAKNVFLWPQSSWLRKGFEVYFTLLIELLWSKERIMEVYLNSIEMGNGIYGAEAVAQEHFNTNAANLTTSQCALIAASLPNPLRFNSAKPTPYMNKRKGQILRQMKRIPHPFQTKP